MNIHMRYLLDYKWKERKMKNVMLVLVILFLIGVMVGCSPAATPTELLAPTETNTTVKTSEPVVTPTEVNHIGGTLNRQMMGMTQFDPIFISDPTFYPVSNIFSLLFRVDGADNEILPDLATSWDILDDGATIVFHLRQGVMWHDGNSVFPTGQSREVVADDVVYSVLRSINTEGAAPPPDLKQNFVSVEALDPYTVKLTLSAPDALLFSRGRGLTKTGIVPHEAIEQLGKDFAFNPIGSGPFKFVEYIPDDKLVLERNDLYWIKPNLDQVIYHVIPDGDTALIAFENGEMDILNQVPPSALDRLASDSDFVLFRAGCPVQAQIIFNVNNPILGELKIRQAISYALDGESINKNVFGSMAIKGAGTAGPGVPGYVADLYDKYFTYDPDAAKTILTDLGWVDTNGDGIREKDGEKLEFTLEVFASDTNAQFGAAIVTQLQAVGMDVTLVSSEMGTYINDIQSGTENAFLMTGWCGEGGTGNLWGRGAFGSALGVSDEQVFTLLDQSNSLLDRSQRDAKLQEATDRIYSLYWGSCLGFSDFVMAARSYVHDYNGTYWHENLVTEKNNVWVDK
jgi:peptide/nickel transport system substrate-binding protein